MVLPTATTFQTASILKSMTILGAGSGLTIIDGSGLTTAPDRIFDVYPGGLSSASTGPITVTISGLKVQKGTAIGYGCTLFRPLGGGLRTQGAILTLDDVTFEANSIDRSCKYGYGGAIYQIAGSLTIKDSILDRNDSFSGGAIYSRAFGAEFDTELTLINTKIRENMAQRGGAIYVEGTDVEPPRKSVNVAIHSSVISGNVVTGTYFAMGGGINFNTHHGFSDTLLLEDTELANNRAIVASGGTGRSQGGAIYLAGGDLTIRDSIVRENVALLEVPSDDPNKSDGGAISIFDFQGDLSVVIADTLFAGNVSEKGGAMALEVNRTTISDSIFTANQALDVDGSGSSGIGGAIYLMERGAGSVHRMTRTTFNENQAGDRGGGLYVAGTTADFYDCDLYQNVADEAGGGFYGGGVVAGSRIHHNRAKNGGGVGITQNTTIAGTVVYSNTAEEHGGGIYIAHAGRYGTVGGPAVDLRNVTISGNRATYGAGFSDMHPPSRIGSDPTSKTHFYNVTLADNAALLEGGGIYHYGKIGHICLDGLVCSDEVDDPQQLSLVNTLLSGNQPFNCGGAMFAGNSTFISKGYNLSSDGSCELMQPQDMLKTAAHIGPLQDNGGATQTHALLDNSPAIDGGSTAEAPSVDQRGITRPLGANADIGAFEYEFTTPYLTVSPTRLEFEAAVGALAPPTQNIQIHNIGIGTLDWTATGSADWVGLNPSNGQAPDTVDVSVNHQGLSEGEHSATVVIDAGVSSGGPQTIPISLTVINVGKLIVDGGFESDDGSAWAHESTQSRQLVVGADDLPYVRPRSGLRAAFLGEVNGETSELSQVIDTPSVDELYLLYFGYVHSDETDCGQDKMFAILGDTVIAEHDLCQSNNNSTWFEHRVALETTRAAPSKTWDTDSPGSASSMQTLRFRMANDHLSNPSTFLLDDVMLIIGKDTPAPAPKPGSEPEPEPGEPSLLFLPIIER
jgi:predicted outer membrane repeat protein